MGNSFKIAIRNLMRYRRRTFLTSLLITVGVVMVILFSGLAGSFKAMMIGQITDSNLAQMQIHKKGYLSSIDTMPLHLNLNQKAYTKIENILKKHGKWKEVDQLDTSALNAIIKEKQWDETLLSVLQQYVRIEESKRLYLSNNND